MGEMWAQVLHAFGTERRLERVVMPPLRAGEVRIRVRAVSVNRGLDLAVRVDGFRFPGVRLPLVGGVDPAGEVVEVAKDVRGVGLGDRVTVFPLVSCGRCQACQEGAAENRCAAFTLVGVDRWGGFAEFVNVPATNLVPLPRGVGWVQASAAALSHVTAWHGIAEVLRLSPGDTVLVMAAAGGVGTAAVQIAKLLGAQVIAGVGSERKASAIRALGADAAVVYGKECWAQEVRSFTRGQGIQAALQTVSGSWAPLLEAMAPGGRIAVCGATGGPVASLPVVPMYRGFITMFGYLVGTRDDLCKVLEEIVRGRIHPVIDSRFSLDELGLAEERVASRQAVGKVMVELAGGQ